MQDGVRYSKKRRSGETILIKLVLAAGSEAAASENLVKKVITRNALKAVSLVVCYVNSNSYLLDQVCMRSICS